MATIGETVQAIEEQMFLGRDVELATFRRWWVATSPVPSILNVTGPGGVGKSALLHAFEREARGDRASVSTVDASSFAHTPEDFLSALGHTEVESVVESLNSQRSLLLFDGFEQLGELTRYLQTEFLPRLETDVKVVIAGRQPLGAAWREWRRFVLEMPLSRLDPADSRLFLARQGLAGEAAEQIIKATGGHPLAMSIAADMAVRFGVRDFGMVGDWPLVVRSLIRELLDEVHDPELRHLLETGAVIRHFDEATLSAVSGTGHSPEAFDKLCRLSVVRSTPRGLLIHEDVRHILAEDLRWRRPDLYASLRTRALEHYRERAEVASPDDRQWLTAERLYLLEDTVVQSVLYGPDEPGEVWVEPGRPEDRPDAQQIWASWIAEDGHGDPAGPEWLDRLLGHPDIRLRVARDRLGRTIGFNTALPVWEGSIALLREHPALASAVDAHLASSEESIPATSTDADLWMLIHSAHLNIRAEAAQAALLRDLVALLGLGKTYLVASSVLMAERLIKALGFEPLDPAASRPGGAELSEPAYRLDLAGLGVEPWIDALMTGRRPHVRAIEELVDLLQGALLHWYEDEKLADSPLREIALNGRQLSKDAGADAVRQLILTALERARTGARRDQELAYRAIELAYLQRALSHERAAERLSVSRSTFYRLLKRGVRGMAQVIRAA